MQKNSEPISESEKRKNPEHVVPTNDGNPSKEGADIMKADAEAKKKAQASPDEGKVSAPKEGKQSKGFDEAAARKDSPSNDADGRPKK